MANNLIPAILIIVVLGVLFISYSNSKVVCDDPYIRFEAGCCIDINANSICDSDEGEITTTTMETTVEETVETTMETTTCEADIENDAENCGACGNVCNVTNNEPSCVNATCVVDCDVNWGDCDADPVTGCETDITASVINCGACGNTCENNHGNTACINSTCVPTCNAGWANCDADPATGCESSINTEVENCGSCENVCVNEHGATACSSGVCDPTCDSGWGNCDSNVINGCEANTDADVNNCGTCGIACDPGQSCVSGVCA